MSSTLTVAWMDDSETRFPIGPDRGWRFDNSARQIIIGHGVLRQHIMLDNVKYVLLDARCGHAPPGPNRGAGPMIPWEPEDDLATECDACGAEPRERCRFGCLGYAIEHDELAGTEPCS